MIKEFAIDFIWIPSALGGHSAGPYTGMRMTIRWQRHIDAYMQFARDIECQLLNFDPKTLQGTAKCFFASAGPIPEDWLSEGELVELLSGFRVLAIGKIKK